MTQKGLHIIVLPARMAICHLEPGSEVPKWAGRKGFCSITRTEEELSVVCPESDVPDGVLSDKGWRCLKIQGPLDLSEVGVLSSLARPLAEAGVSIFAISTFDTDYLLVRDEELSRAVMALGQARHEVISRGWS